MTQWFQANELLVQATLVSFLLALSLQVPFRWGVFSFAGLGAYTIAAYTAGILVLRLSLDTWTAILIAAATASLACYLFSFLVSRLGGLYLGMATIAFDLILTVIALNGGKVTGNGTLFGVLGEIHTWQILAACVIAAAALAFTERGRLGRQVEAASVDPELALAMGIRVVTLRQMSFAISGLVGGLAGGINIIISTTVSPAAVGFHLIITALTMIIVGGARSWLGALIGAVILTWLPELLHVVNQWKLALFGIIVTVLSVWLPDGLLGLFVRLYRRARTMRTGASLEAAAPTKGTAS